MSAIFKIKRRIGGTQAVPGGTGAEGELALYYPGAAGDTTKPSLYASDGAGWRLVNPTVAITTQSVDLGSVAADVGNAYAAWAAASATNKLTGNVVIGTFGTPKQAYVLTDTANPQTAASWTPLGGAVQFATRAEIVTGTNTVKAINPKGLGDNTVQTPSNPHTNDAQKYIILNGAGKINSGFYDVEVQHIGLPGGLNIGAAYTTWAGNAGNTLTGKLIIADFGTPTKSYILTDPTKPNLVASWQAIGGAVDVATAAEIHSATANKVVTADILRGETKVTPDATPANDADYLIRLGATGKIDAGFLPAAPTAMRGAKDVTTALVQPNPAYKAGDMIFVSAAGAVHASYAGAAGTQVKAGDSLLFDGTNWHVIPNETDLNDYIPLRGSNQITGNLVWAGAAANKAGVTIFDGKGGTIDNVVLDGGTY